MRLAFVLTAVPGRTALEPGPVDLEWLRALGDHHDLELFVDQATPASEELRRAGVKVSVSTKRAVTDARGEKVCADALQARVLRRSHEAAAFDAVVYGSDASVDLAWFEPELASIPRGVALGAGLARDLRVVWEDRELFALEARRLWGQTGVLASADFMLSDVAPEAFGLVDDGRLPPRYSTGAPDPVAAAARDPEAGRWVAVAATTAGSRSLEDLVRRVAERVPPEEATTYLVVTRPHLPGGRTVQEALLDDCPEPPRRRVAVVPAGPDGVAAEFLDAADTLIVSSRAELAVPAVADAARRLGFALLDDDAGPASPPTGAFPGRVPRPRDAAAADREAQVRTWEPTGEAFRKGLLDAVRDTGEDALLLIHAPDHAGPGVRLLRLAPRRGVDLVVWGRPDGVLGHPDPAWLYPYALAVRAAAVPALVRALERCGSIWDLVCWAVSHESIDRLRLLLLPAPAETEFWPVRDPGFPAPRWSPRSGILPAPRWIPVPVAETPEGLHGAAECREIREQLTAERDAALAGLQQATAERDHVSGILNGLRETLVWRWSKPLRVLYHLVKRFARAL